MSQVSKPEEAGNLLISWTPSLNPELTLRTIHATLPGNMPEEIPRIIRLLENPSSPVALPGAINLFNHDCVHILLGRGLLPQDEAFVIGFTMGNSRRLNHLQWSLFRWCSHHLYSGPYRFSKEDLQVFDLGVMVGQASRAERLCEIDFTHLQDEPIGSLRLRLGMEMEELYAAYALERRMRPSTAASERLPQWHGRPLASNSDLSHRAWT